VSNLQQITRRVDWLSAAVLSGFIATGVMTIVVAVAYGIAAVLVLPTRRPRRCCTGCGAREQHCNPEDRDCFSNCGCITFRFGHRVGGCLRGFGTAAAAGTGLRQGMLFSLIPWMLSVGVFLPIVGGGPLGLRLRAGPLPIFGNLILHLIYGGVLGQIYGPMGDRLLTETGETDDVDELQTLANEQRLIALGIVAGRVVGGRLRHVAVQADSS
jgi:hypothetical protein